MDDFFTEDELGRVAHVVSHCTFGAIRANSKSSLGRPSDQWVLCLREAWREGITAHGEPPAMGCLVFFVFQGSFE